MLPAFASVPLPDVTRALWYAAVNQLAAADYMGTVLVHGRPAGPSALLVAGIAMAMPAVTFGIRAVRHATR